MQANIQPECGFFHFRALDCGSLQHFISKDHRELVQVNILSIEVGRRSWNLEISSYIRSQIQKYRNTGGLRLWTRRSVTQACP